MDKEIFTDVTRGEKHEVDVLMKARFRGQEAFFLTMWKIRRQPKATFPSECFVTLPASRKSMICLSIRW